MRLAFAFLLLLQLAVSQATGQGLTIGPWEKIVPSTALPDGLRIYRGNNNLDVTAFEGRFYFAFRTAPSHFASRKARLHILSSSDRVSWRHESSIQLGADLREPRFAIHDNQLFFYFFQGGINPLGFSPEHVYACMRAPDGSWTSPTDLHLDGYVPWRIRPHAGRLYMSAYYGKGLYTNTHVADMRLYVSNDGLHWEPISPEPQLGGQGGEEGEFIFDAEGDLWGTVRVEGGGAMIMHAKRESLHRWETWPTSDKYDSALLFRDGEEIYLVARRNLDGTADKGKRLPKGIARYYNLVRYSATRKTTAIWRLDRKSHTLIHLLDVGGTGDTAFPGIVELGDGKWWLLNYSSDIDGPAKSWIRGQLGKTYIYAAEVSRR